MFPREIESSVHMRLYSLTKRQFVFVMAFFFISYAITLCIGLLGPPIVIDIQQNASQTVNDSTTLSPSDSPTYHLRSPPFSVFHQQFWLTARFFRKSSSLTTLSVPLQLWVLLDTVSHVPKDPINSIHITEHRNFNRTRDLKCDAETCGDIIVAHMGFLDAVYYIIHVRFHIMDEKMSSLLRVNDVLFEFKFYNPVFTQFEIWFRFAFLVASFIATCRFSHSLRTFRIRDWSIEQKWISVLLPLLLLFNNPLLPLNFLLNSWVPNTLDSAFQATFLCALLLFWLCVYHGVRQSERHFVTFYLPKLAVVGVMWVSVVALAGWQALHENHDPTYYYRLDTASFLLFKILFFSLGAIYLLYLLYLLIRAFAELRNMPYFSVRLRFLTVLMLLVILLSGVFTILRFGVRVLQDNFIAEIATNYENSLEFCGIYGLLNLYLFTMAYVYSPSKNAHLESHFKDNPTISMINDSDEDVVYGSDYEETALMTEGRQN